MDYINERLNQQMQYYKDKCKKLQGEFYSLSIISITVNALIPVLSIAVDSFHLMKYIIALLSALVSISSSILLLKRTKDRWIGYRTTYEQLKKEKILFELGAGSYGDKNIQVFAERCEKIMQDEHSLWKIAMKNTSEEGGQYASIN